jgi:hypothetical protein
VTLDAGETGTCVVTNTAAENTATLLIMKECVGTDDGSTFTIKVSGGIGSVALNCGETSGPLTINAGTQYTVSETPPTGWTGPDIRGACDGDGTVTLDAGETGTCVVTNTEAPAPPASNVEPETTQPQSEVLGVQVIIPPNTGDAGLRDSGASAGSTSALLWVAGAASAVVLMGTVFATSRKRWLAGLLRKRG